MKNREKKRFLEMEPGKEDKMFTITQNLYLDNEQRPETLRYSQDWSVDFVYSKQIRKYRELCIYRESN